MVDGADEVVVDVAEEPAHVPQAGTAGSGGAEDRGSPLGDVGQLGVHPGTGQERPVPDVLVDDVAVAPLSRVAFAADQFLLLEVVDGLGDRGRADPQVLDQFG
ncbi:hypothetical protein ACIBHY_26000 [Nonomuraea sp. NPDC050547]|uniref:hypothetical protein n=1 Tax=Nonomuraea sp. NPDC050547 TaxID=3364368 RepID=UPI00379FC74B